MFQKKILANSEMWGAKEDCFENVSPIKKIVYLVGQLGSDFGIVPSLQVLESENIICVLFEYTGFECDELLEEYGGVMASISKTYPISICGMLESLEMGELSAHFKDDGLVYEKSCPSGQSFDALSSVYIKIALQNEDEISLVKELLPCCRQHSMAFHKKYSRLLKDTEYWGMHECTHFLFLEMNSPNGLERDLSQTLTVPQLVELWQMFLQDGSTPVELDIIYEQIKDIYTPSLLRLELSLQIALAASGFKVTNDESGFAVLDNNGKRLKYDFLSGYGAEKLFLKILFPVKVNHEHAPSTPLQR